MKSLKRLKKNLYVSNVTNSSHIDYLFKEISGTNYLMTPWVPSDRIIAGAKFISERYSQILSSRSNDRNLTVNFKRYNLGFQQFYAPFKLIFFGKPMNVYEVRLINFMHSVRAATKMRGKSLVILTKDVFPHFIKSPKTVLIVEMRENICGVFDRNKSVFTDFPTDTNKSNQRVKRYAVEFDSIKTKSKGLITYSEMTRDTFIAKGYAKERIFVFPLRIPLRGIYNAELKNPNQCLFVGRDELNKGLDLAVAITAERNLKLKVVGHYSENMKRWLKQFPHVDFLGYVNRNALKKIMLQSHVLIACSVESFGLTVIEALESGCLVVSSKFNGAAQTFRNNPNVFCSNSLSQDALSYQLDLALKVTFNNEYTSDIADFSKEFSDFIARIS